MTDRTPSAMMKKVKLVRIDKLREPKRNPNVVSREEFEALVAAMREYGFTQPVLVDTTGEIVDGVHRVRAAKLLGWETVIVVEDTWDEEKKRLLQIAMNRLRGTLDLGQVALVLRDVALETAMTEDELATLTGYSVRDVEELLKATDRSGSGAPPGAFQAPEDDGKEAAAPKPFELEGVRFATRAELAKVKKKLRKAGNGDLARGLLAIIEGA